MYVDLAYIPNHCSGKTADLDFFRRVRASYYVVSGNDPANGEPSRAVLDALLEGKAQWGENLQVSSKGRTREGFWSKFCQRQQQDSPYSQEGTVLPPSSRFIYDCQVFLPLHLSFLHMLTSGMFASA